MCYSLAESQKKIAMITEMLHTATLIHDDVIDASDTRRGKESINYVWGQRKVTTLTVASQISQAVIELD